MHLANRVQLGVLAPELLQFGWIPRGGGVGQLPGDLLRPRERLAESVVHGLARSGLGSVLLAEALHAAGGIEQLLLAGEEGMATGAHFDVDYRRRRARDKAVPTRALHRRPLIFR